MQSDGLMKKSIGPGKDVTGCTKIMELFMLKKEEKWNGEKKIINSYPH